MAYTTIDDPSAHFQTVTWAGTDTQDTAITFDGNSNLQPDLFWNKGRGVAFGHVWMDTSRGIGNTGKVLDSSSANAEFNIDDYFETADTNGFTIGRGSAGFNATNDTYVTWCWKANGGTTSSNTDGTITTTVQANTTAGFSIVTYTGNGSSGQTIGHGLGTTPDMMMVKNRSGAYNWAVYHKDSNSSPEDYYAQLNTTNAFSLASDIWGTSAATSTVIGVKNFNETNASSSNYVAYCFAEKQGYSKFGKYTGNGNANGTFVYTGFKPAFVMTKVSNTTGSWSLYDHKRLGYNPIDVWLRANGNDVESTSAISGEDIDLYSNGFKLRNSDNTINASGSTYIYMAFAEQPFVTSTGIPTTAR